MIGSRIEIVVSATNFRRWHERLCDRLRRLSPQSLVHIRVESGGESWPGPVTQLLALERLLLRGSRPTLSDLLEAPPAPQGASGTPYDLVVDLTGGGAARAVAPPVLRPLYEGQASELAAIAALLDGASPTLTLEDANDGAVVATALPALEAADGLTGGLEAVLSRVVTMIEQALLSPARSHEPAGPTPPARKPASVALFALRSIAFQCARRLYHLCCCSPHWRIGWRFNDGLGVIDTGALTGERWSVMQDRDLNFAADPFPIEWRGQTCVFFERLDARTDKGVIFAQRFGDSGPVGQPFPVLEEPWHLSYPFLIAHRGELYMLPEASTSNAVSLYRCIEFPTRWERVAELVTNIEAADATLFEQDGRFWMTSVVRDGLGGYSDTLAIHHAPDLLGPWEEHAQRPVLVDSRYARPAGAVVRRNGALWRPVQDCSEGYGKRIVIMRIDALDAETFVQTPSKLVAPGRPWPGARLHTLNRCGRLECIDGAILTPRNLFLRRQVHRIIDDRDLRPAEPNENSGAPAVR